MVQQAETAVLGHDFRGESCTRCGEKNADYKALTAGRWVWYAPAESGETMAFYILTFAEDRTFNLVADTAESIDNFDPEVQAALRENQPARLIDFEGKTYVTPMASFGYPGTYVVNADGTIALTGEEWIGGSAALQYVGGDKLEVLSDDQVGLPEQLVFQEAVHKHLFMDAATCTTPMICAICGETKGEALGHDYKAEVIAPTTDSEGYTLHTCSRCGDSYKDNYTEKLPQTANVTYTVTVTDFDGAPMSGVAVQILKDGKAAKVGVTDTNGKLSAELAAGDYTVKLAFSATGNHYDESIAVLSANVTELTIRVTSAVPSPGVVDHWMLGNADEVGLGGTYVTTQKNVMTYFLFTPTEAGTYSFTTSNPAAVISYWGGESFPSNQTANTDYKDNRFTLSVSQSYLGQTYVVGITGANSCILIIEKQGEAAFDPNEVPYTEYELAEQPKAFTATETGTLTFVDLSGKPEDYELVKGQDGFYHFGTADGPIAYICLGSKAPYLSLYTMCGGGGAMSGAPFRYADYSDLDNIVKEDYTAAVLAYGDCMDATYGVYPVTEDLIYIMQMGVEYKSWAKSESPNFLFTDVADFNAEMGWMFLFCYFQK